jgi:hypothetical protein
VGDGEDAVVVAPGVQVAVTTAAGRVVVAERRPRRGLLEGVGVRERERRDDGREADNRDDADDGQHGPLVPEKGSHPRCSTHLP